MSRIPTRRKLASSPSIPFRLVDVISMQERAMPKANLTSELKDEYQRLFDSCVINTGQQAEVERFASRIGGSRARYEAVGGALDIPWHFIAVIHHMESSQDFTRHLHNGDPLAARTVQVPAGRPVEGDPPFTWEQSATDSLTLRRLDRWLDWSVAGLLYSLEGYNGWGYRLYHPHVLSPYLWGHSNHYVSGKYVADGRWSDSAVSKQCGAAVLLRRMAERGMVDLEQHGVSKAVERALAGERPILRYSSTAKIEYAQELQEFLNRFPGIYVKPDGWPGENTSDAFRKVTGRYLDGDPRATN